MKIAILGLFVVIAAVNAGHYGHGPYYGRGIYQKVRSHYGNTAFAYDDGLSTRNEHIGYDGSAVGSYSVRNADGSVRTVKYKAGKDGFEIVGDDGSVKEDNVARAAALAEVAAELAKAAPEAPAVPDVPDVPDVPEVPEADLPVAPTNAPDYGQRNKDVYENRKKYYGHKHIGYHHGGYYGGYGYGGYGYGGHRGYYGHYAPVAVKEAKPEAPKFGYGYGGYAGYGPYAYGPHHGIYQKVRSHYGNTAFAYNDGLSTRNEHIAFDGSAVGSYSVKDADGSTRTVKYKAGANGFEILGDDGSVKEDNVARAAALAEVAAELAKAAPKAPEVPDVPDVPDVPEVPEADLPVAPTNAPDYGQRNKDVYENRKKYYGSRHYGYAGYGYPGYGYGYPGYGYGHGRYYGGHHW